MQQYFLPYQVNWLKDRSKIKIWDKSRRIGATYTQAYEDVLDCSVKNVPAVWFSSSDESAGKEYIEYCEHWARILNIAAEYIGETIIDSESDIKALQIRFKNGTKITALSSNPKALRSKGGKLILDEFAHHDNARKLWSAARPISTWGFPIRIMSTHNGINSLFNRFIKSVKSGDLNWSLHETSIYDAVKDGLYEKILGRKPTKKEIEAWLDELRRDCFDERTWLEEYCRIPQDEASAFLDYELINSCEDKDILMPLEKTKGDLYLGMDIARRKHLSVIWIVEKIGRIKFTRAVKVMEKMKFSSQREILFEYLKHRRMRRACIDATGLGMQLAEEAQEQFGKYNVEGITFTNNVKEELAYPVLRNFEDRSVLIPDQKEIREDLHSLRKLTTASGNIRFDVDGSEQINSHADYFWALALAIHAGDEYSGPVQVSSRKKRESYNITKGYGSVENIIGGY